MRTLTILRPLAYGILGLLYALGTAFVALLMTGAGHGWMSATICWFSVFLLPLLGVALGLKQKSVRLFLLWTVVLGMFALDVRIILTTQNEGWDHAVRVWRSIPGILILWAIAWLCWQTFAIHALATTYGKNGDQ
jgi:hypothetical protein